MPKRIRAPARSAAPAVERIQTAPLKSTGRASEGSASTALPSRSTSANRVIVSALLSSSSSTPIRPRTGSASCERKHPQTLSRGKCAFSRTIDARPGAREGARRGGAREAAADHRDVAIVLQGRFQTSSQTKREAIVTRAPGRTGAAIAAISSDV